MKGLRLKRGRTPKLCRIGAIAPRQGGWTLFGLPASPATARRGKLRAELMSPMLPQRRPILVVEDHPEMLDAVVTVLERQGWAAVPARNGEEALEQLNQGLRPSLFLVDLMLPKVSGWALLQHVREQAHLREIPTLVITGFPRENLRVMADVVLHKPVDYDRLVNAVRDLTESGSLRTRRTSTV
jgi:CheY-like chemotaxis protein